MEEFVRCDLACLPHACLTMDLWTKRKWQVFMPSLFTQSVNTKWKPRIFVLATDSFLDKHNAFNIAKSYDDNFIEKFKLTWKVRKVATDNATSIATAFQALCNFCDVFCYHHLHAFSFLLLFRVLFNWLLFNGKAKTFKLWEIAVVKPDLAPLQEPSTTISAFIAFTFLFYKMYLQFRFVINYKFKNNSNYNCNLRFLAQSDCNVIENFEGVIVIIIECNLMKLIHSGDNTMA